MNFCIQSVNVILMAPKLWNATPKVTVPAILDSLVANVVNVQKMLLVTCATNVSQTTSIIQHVKVSKKYLNCFHIHIANYKIMLQIANVLQKDQSILSVMTTANANVKMDMADCNVKMSSVMHLKP